MEYTSVHSLKLVLHLSNPSFDPCSPKACIKFFDPLKEQQGEYNLIDHILALFKYHKQLYSSDGTSALLIRSPTCTCISRDWLQTSKAQLGARVSWPANPYIYIVIETSPHRQPKWPPNAVLRCPLWRGLIVFKI